MAKVNLTEEEKSKLIELINNSSEVPLDMLQKLGPGFFDKLSQEGKFDFATLEKFKVPTLEYAGKRPENVILASAALTGGNAPLQVERCFESGNETNGKSQLTIFEESQKVDKNWRNLIVQGDNLQFLKTCYINKDPLIKDKVKGKVKLIYIDPPFGTGDEYGINDAEMSYSAKVNGAEFLEGMRERLIYLKEILSNDGSLYLRIDYHFGHALKAILDEVFYGNFMNEIVINRFKRQLRGLNKFNVATDSLFIYSKTNNPIFNEQLRSRLCSFCGHTAEPKWIPMTSPGLRNPPERIIIGKKMLPPRGRHWTFTQDRVNAMQIEGRIRNENTSTWIDLNGIRQIGVPEYLQTEETPADSNWTDLKGYVRSSRYPTENPEELLERVILTSSKEDDLVMDCFAGSGTTGAVAEKLGRRWIMCDFGKHSIYTMQKRLLRIGESKKLGQNAGKNAKYGQGPKPFCVASCGGYDFTRIMNLRENKDAYITFVLGLFNLGKTEENYLKKYKLPNIYGEKENNPVEVYPVWENEYLKNVKIDGEYLQGIIDQTGGKIKGDYYIITPVSCSNVADTTLENEKHEPVNFKILSFPYKILEEASRSFEIKEQPSSSKNINDLITSVGFYFNEQVEVSAKKTTSGFQITKLKSEITDSSGNKYQGIAGLAMVLIDKNYNGKVFDMEQAVYSADIKEDGKIKTPGITSCTHIIAIDKHGNESKITAVK